MPPKACAYRVSKQKQSSIVYKLIHKQKLNQKYTIELELKNSPIYTQKFRSSSSISMPMCVPGADFGGCKAVQTHEKLNNTANFEVV